MEHCLDSPTEDLLVSHGFNLVTPERTFKKKYDFAELEVIQTPIPATSNIFNQLLEASKHSSLKFVYQTPQRSSKPAIMEELQNSAQTSQIDSSSNLQVIAKKSRKLYIPKPSDGPKSCNCTKSNCLKKYCDCFKLGLGCSQSCKCYDCKNKQLSLKKTAPQIRCNCKKSECLKNYCECHLAGVKCSTNCGCVECKNEPEIKETIKKRRKLDSN